MIIWPGGEGYNYPFQTPYAESWRRLIDGIGQAAETLGSHGRTLFLEHKNSEPAMKIHMGNIGMTLHVIHTLRRQGIENVKVNMDWQHLIMNGEHLPEYAALLAAEDLLGHQHANSGWGTFDDDNMVGAMAFMETIELALELRRAGYGASGERLGFDLYPYTEDQVGAVGARCCSGASWTRSPRGSTTPSCARSSSARTPSRPTSSSTRRSGPRRRERGWSAWTSAPPSVKGIAIDPDGRVLGDRRARPRCPPRAPVAEQDPEDWWAAHAGGPGRARGGLGGGHRADRPDARARRARRRRAPAAPRDPVERRAHAGRMRRARGARGLERLVALTGNRALAGFTGPKLAWLRDHEPAVHAAIEHVLLPKDHVRLRLTGEHATDVTDASGTLLFDVAARPGARRCARCSASPSPGCRPPWSPGRSAATRRPACPSPPAPGDQAAGALGVGVVRAGGAASLVLGTSGVVFAAQDAFAADPQARVHAFCHAVPGAWHVMGVPGATTSRSQRSEPAGRQHHAHRVPGARDRVAEGVDARLRVGGEGVLGGEHHPGGPEDTDAGPPAPTTPTPSAPAAWSPAPAATGTPPESRPLSVRRLQRRRQPRPDPSTSTSRCSTRGRRRRTAACPTRR